MYTKIVPLNPEQFQGISFVPLSNYAFAAKEHLLPLAPEEWKFMAREAPIVFVRSGSEESPHVAPYALMGLRQGQNLFVDSQGQWRGEYVPAAVRRYPFILAQSEDQETMVVCADMESGAFQKSKKGQALFTEDGQPTETLNTVKNFLERLQRQFQAATQFASRLDAAGLLVDHTIEIKRQGQEPQHITGMLRIDETKWNALDDTSFLEWRQQGALPLVYAHLLSLGAGRGLGRLLGTAAPGTSTSPQAEQRSSGSSGMPDSFNFG